MSADERAQSHTPAMNAGNDGGAAPEATGAAAPTENGGSTASGKGRGTRRRRGPQQPHGPGFGPPGLIGSGEKAKDFKGSFKRLVRRLRPERSKIILIILLSIISVACTIAGPKILAQASNLIVSGVVSQKLPAGVTQQQAVDMLRSSGQTNQADMLAGMSHIVPGQGIDFAAVGKVLLIVAAIYLLSALFGWLGGYTMAGVVARTIYSLRKDIDLKLARLPLKYFDGHARGDILSRVTNDIDNIQQTMQQTLSQIITSILTLIGVLAMMFWISPLLAVICLITVPISVVITMFIAKRSQKQFAVQWERTGALTGHVEETFSGHTIVKIFGRQKEAIATFDEENEELYEASFKAQFISGIIMPMMMFVGNLQYVAIAVVGGLRVATGALGFGEVQAFIQYSQMFMQPITQTASVANVLQSAVASAERVFELLDEPEQTAETVRPVVLKHVAGHVEFKNVSFRYLPDVPLIDDLSIEVQPGQTVAIVGPTGAGKTTLVNLLMRFYEIDEGEILVDGVDTRDMTRDDLRRLFGMVLQDAWLFSGTIRDNIAYGKEDATELQIRAAAEAAHVDHFVRTMPDGYDTKLDDDSANVSQGERQLLTIARAFLADPEILILDEATSSVDTRTEVLIQRAMARLLTGRTSFVIAHRLSTIRDADLILVMNEGAIVEQGTHEQLLAAAGFYYDLYHSQFVEALAEAS
jgi:ATP-binding cassette, subfamily B, multidrug efflux pump